jgi:hypothetical protein
MAYEHGPDHTDRTVVSYDLPVDEATALVARAGGRLAAAGWDVDDPWVDTDGWQTVGAARDGLEMAVSAGPASPGSSGTLAIVVTKESSPAAAAALVAGTLGGLAIGWPTMVWVLHRQRRQRPSVAATMIVFGVPATAVAGLAVTLTLYVALVVRLTDPTPKDVQLPIFVLTAFPGFPVASGLAALAMLVLAAMPAGWPRGPSTVRRATGEPA